MTELPYKNPTQIVVIEDDNFLSDAYKIKFEQMGFQIQLAQDGESGLKMVKKLAPRLVILDLMLPKMDGIEVLKRLKADPETQQIPVVIASNFADETRQQSCRDLGVVDFFVKSEISIADLIQKCEKYLSHPAHA
jgi:CheY-like chemotaxis protein